MYKDTCILLNHITKKYLNILIFFNFFCIIIVEKYFRYYLYNEK